MRLPLALLLLAGGCLGPPADVGPECGRLSLEAEPRVVTPGRDVVFTATFANCGDVVLERTTSCADPGWTPFTDVGGTRWRLAEGSAVDVQACLPALGSWRVEPNALMRASWTWNGTLQSCHDGPCVTRDAPPGEYVFASQLSRRDARTMEGEGAWTASVPVRVEAGP